MRFSQRVLVKIIVSWDAALCQVAENYRNFETAYDLQVQAVEEA
jgi:hypothetical protein